MPKATSGPLPLPRTLAGVRTALFEALERLRSGDLSPTEATATSGLAKEIINAAALQLKYEDAYHHGRIGKTLREIELAPDGTLKIAGPK